MGSHTCEGGSIMLPPVQGDAFFVLCKPCMYDGVDTNENEIGVGFRFG